MDINTVLDDLYQYGNKKIVKKNDYIYNPEKGFSSKYAYFLDSGFCSLFEITKSGNEKVYLYFKEKRIIGFSQFMSKFIKDKTEGRPFHIIAKTDCILYQVKEDVYYKLLDQNSEFRTLIINVLSENYLDVLNRMYQMQEESAVVRLCGMILDYSICRKGKKILPSFFTYAEMAKYIGTHQVTVSRIMAKLKQYGYISKDGHCTVIEREDCLKKIMELGEGFDY
jgi:CRP-like cAMP-binding protein